MTLEEKTMHQIIEVWPRFAIWMLMDPFYGMWDLVETEEHRKIILNIRNAFDLVIGDPSEVIDWASLVKSAEDAGHALDPNYVPYDPANDGKIINVPDVPAPRCVYALYATSKIADVQHRLSLIKKYPHQASLSAKWSAEYALSFADAARKVA